MASITSNVKYTYEDYELFPDDGRRHELIEGEHYVTPSPFAKHQSTVVKLTIRLGGVVEQRRLGWLFVAPFDVVLSDLDVVQPDLLFVSAKCAEVLTEKHVRGAPDLVVEVLSESTRRTDEIVKRKLYERFGVREYWVVDPVLESVKVYRLEEGAFRRAAELTAEAGDALETPLFPGLAIPLSEIFE